MSLYFIIAFIVALVHIILSKKGYVIYNKDGKEQVLKTLKQFELLPTNVVDGVVIISCILSGLFWIITIPKYIILAFNKNLTIEKF